MSGVKGLSGRKLGTKNIAQRIRGYLTVALDDMAKKGLPLDKLIVKGLKDDLKGTLTALAKFMPAEVAVTVDDKRVKDISDNDLIDIAQSSVKLIEDKAQAH